MKTKSVIQSLRAHLRVSRKEFGKMLNVSGAAIAYYEGAVRYPKKEIAYKIIDIAGVNGFEIKLEDIYPRKVD